MKYLSHYVNEGTTKAMSKFGAFFAFSYEQLEKRAQYGVKYAKAGEGMIVPVYNISNLNHAMNVAFKDGMKQDLKENGVKAIIHRELANYECGITGDYSDALASLKPYGITESQILAEWPRYLDNCFF